MKKWISAVHEQLSRQQPVVMALILSQEGSTPRAAGTRMMIAVGGSIAGTVGGGRIEASVMETAREMLGSAGAVIRSFDLTSEIVDAMDMICGGKLEILLEAIPPDETHRNFFFHVLTMLNLRQKGVLVTELQETGDSRCRIRRAILEPDGEVAGEPALKSVRGLVPEKLRAPFLIAAGGCRYFMEPVMSQGTVFLFGAGHVSQQTALFAKQVGFEVAVLDDRKEFASTSRFPDADSVTVLDSFDDALSGQAISRDSYLVILTRGHLHDKTVLAQCLRTPAGYIGMIGSRKKRDTIYRALETEGFSAADLEAVHCPIGLSIGAQTPEEIAVSIVAELIAARSAG